MRGEGLWRPGAAISAYDDHLRVERGLSAATIRAYDRDLRLFAAMRRALERWATAPDPARGYLAALTRPPRAPAAVEPSSQGRRDPRLLSLLLRGGAHRAGHRGPPGPAAASGSCRRRSGATRSRRSWRPPTPRTRRACATGPCWSCCTRPACGSSEAVGLDRQDLSLERGFVRVIGKGDKERMVPVGDVALEAIARVPRACATAVVAGAGRGAAARRRAARCSSRPRPPAWPDGGLAGVQRAAPGPDWRRV